MHAFTGCDSISAFAGRGKTTAFKLLKSDKTHQEVFNQLGHSWDLSAELLQRLQQITCQMYLLSTRTTEVNKLRYQLSVPSVERWSPVCSHLVRTVFSCMPCVPTIRLQYGGDACSANPSFQAPRIMAGSMTMMVSWMWSGCEDLLHQMLCYSCCLVTVPGHANCKDCSCLSNGLWCTDMCKLQTCDNQAMIEEQAAELTDSDTDYDEN